MAKTLDGIVHRFTIMPPECTEKNTSIFLHERICKKDAFFIFKKIIRVTCSF